MVTKVPELLRRRRRGAVPDLTDHRSAGTFRYYLMPLD
jgi:hypothetical protein